MSGRGIPFTNDKVSGDIDYKMDSSDSSVDASKLASFFTSVQYNESTVDVTYTGYTTGVITDISIAGVTFEGGIFKNVPTSVTTFTFKLDSVTTTATKSGETWSFV